MSNLCTHIDGGWSPVRSMFDGWSESVDRRLGPGTCSVDSSTATSRTTTKPIEDSVRNSVSAIDWSLGSSASRKSKGPPCKVCGDEASGFHYGVDSCEGCKGFFRRCITQGMTHQCSASQTCEITPYSRNSCQFCRLKKCLDIGMSREASRLGRRPKRLQEARRLREVHESASASAADREYQLNQAAATAVMGLQQLYRRRQRPLDETVGNSCGSSNGGGGQSALSMGDIQMLMQSLSEGTSGRLLSSSTSSSTGFGADVKPPISPNESFRRLSMSEMSPCSSYSSSATNDSMSYHPSSLNVHMAVASAAAATRGGSSSITTSFPPLPSPVIGGGYLSPTDLQGEPLGALRDLQAFTIRVSASGTPSSSDALTTATTSSPGASSPRQNQANRRDVGGYEPAGGASLKDRCVCTFCGCSSSLSRSDRSDTGYSTSAMTSSNDVESMTTRGGDSDSGSSSPTGDGDAMQVGGRNDGDSRAYASASAMTAELSPDTTVQQSSHRRREGDRGHTRESNAQSSPALHDGCSSQKLSNKLCELAMLVKLPYNERRKELIKRATENVIGAHIQTCNYTSEKLATNLRGYEEMMRGKPEGWDLLQLKTSSETPESASWFHQFIQNMEPVIKRVVNFCKLLEAFREFSMEDEVTLVKQGVFAVIIVRYSRLFTDKGMFIPTMKARIPRSKIPLMMMGDFFEKQYQFADKFNLLNLDDAEIGLLTSCLILNPDSYDDHFNRILDIVPLIEHINTVHLESVANTRIAMPTIPFPELHKEVFEQP